MDDHDGNGFRRLLRAVHLDDASAESVAALGSGSESADPLLVVGPPNVSRGAWRRPRGPTGVTAS